MAVSESSKNRTIVDTMQVIVSGVFGVFLSFFVIFFVVALFYEATTLKGFLLFLLAIALFVAFVLKYFFTFKMQKQGFIVNAESGTLSYPGGGRFAGNLKNYLSIGHWVQSFRRYDLNIAEIAIIDPYSVSLLRRIMFPILFLGCNHFIILEGEFGQVKLTFWSKRKRDELCSLLLDMTGLEKGLSNPTLI